MLLITGGTGTTGSALAALAAGAGLEAKVFSRRPPAEPVLPWAQGDLRRRGDLQAALAGVDTLFVLTPYGEDETVVGLQAVEAARQAGVVRLIYLSIHNLEAMSGVPHFAAKQPIEAAVKGSGLDWAILRANHFFQNDLMAASAFAAGVYPLPLGAIGLHAVDARDVAQAAFRLAASPAAFSGRTLPLCGRTRLTGEAGAAAWTAALGRPVAYAGDDLDAWDTLLARTMPAASPWLRSDLRLMMAQNQAQGCLASDTELAGAADAVGGPLRTYTASVAEFAGALRPA